MHRSLRALTCSLSLSLLVLPLAAQQPGMPVPGPEHKQLAAQAGTWDAVLETMGPDGKPTQSKGVSERRVGPGGFWLIDDFHADMLGTPFTGHGALGYDPVRKLYVQSWVDSMSPMLMTMEGTFDKSGKVLTMTGMGPGPQGTPIKMRLTTTMPDANTEVFEMYATGPDGKEQRMLKITYTRRAANAKLPAK